MNRNAERNFLRARNIEAQEHWIPHGGIWPLYNPQAAAAWIAAKRRVGNAALRVLAKYPHIIRRHRSFSNRAYPGVDPSNIPNVILAQQIVSGVRQSHARRIQSAWRGHRVRAVNVPRLRIEKAERNWAPGGYKARILAIRYPPNNRPRLKRSKSASPRRNRNKNNRPRSA